MKKVLFFTHNLAGGGAEKAVCLIASWYAAHPEKGVDPSVLVVYDNEDEHKKLDRAGVKVTVMKTASKRDDPVVKKAVNVLRQAAELRKLKKQMHIDTCVSFLPGADIINSLSRTGERRVVSVRSRESLFVHSVWKKWYVKFSYNRADMVVAVSDVVKRDLEDYFGEDPAHVVTIPNVIYPPTEADRDCDDEQFAGYARDRRVICSVGRLSPEKNQETLIRAFAGIAADREDIHLALVGDGPQRDTLRKLAGDLGISGRVYFAGQRRNPAQYLLKSDIFVLPSLVEGIPNALLEAMACGVPVISSDCGVRQIIDPSMGDEELTGVAEGECGLIVPVGDDAVLAEALEKLLDDPELCDRFRQAAGKCLEPYSEQIVMDKWTEVI